ncbi:hypothetical protein EP164_01810 [Photorhabdus luminescens subsp. sonorensis]|uniref:Type IV secretion system putative lipoprotein virB7 n=2 Tax=Photorhabdus luminescens TaxID=29488 RepID=A0A5C4RMS5_PHOLU|nr:hypothetical protein EP164_01810 [Photorhabdus luminescens subsp. sonorensis]
MISLFIWFLFKLNFYNIYGNLRILGMNKFLIALLSIFMVTGCSMPQLSDAYVSTCGHLECNIKDIISGEEVKVDTTHPVPDFDKNASIQDRQIIQSGGRPSFEKESYRIRGTFKF